MPKKTKESKLLRGYSDWSRLKTFKEAVNVSRWNPWLAHEWMNEACRGISINDYLVMEINRRMNQVDTDDNSSS